MNTITTTGFALVDVSLFLDTHPSCQEALDYFRNTKAIYDKAMQEYAEKYGPLRQNVMCSDDVWTWNSGKMPWEGSDC